MVANLCGSVVDRSAVMELTNFPARRIDSGICKTFDISSVKSCQSHREILSSRLPKYMFFTLRQLQKNSLNIVEVRDCEAVVECLG